MAPSIATAMSEGATALRGAAVAPAAASGTCAVQCCCSPHLCCCRTKTPGRLVPPTAFMSATSLLCHCRGDHGSTATGNTATNDHWDVIRASHGPAGTISSAMNNLTGAIIHGIHKTRGAGGQALHTLEGITYGLGSLFCLDRLTLTEKPRCD